MARDDGAKDAARRYRAARERFEQLAARAQWWERWRGVLIGPMIVAAALVGAGIAWSFRQLAPVLPSQTEAYAAVVGVVAVGRWASVHFNPRKLEVARRVVRELERDGRGSAPSHLGGGR